MKNVRIIYSSSKEHVLKIVRAVLDLLGDVEGRSTPTNFQKF
jgi:hypothetical protein